MQQKKRKKKFKRKIERFCQDCRHCEYIGEGDYICTKHTPNVKIVISDFMQTEDYMYCNKWNK